MQLFKFKFVYYLAIVFSFLTSCLFGYIVVSKINTVTEIGLFKDDLIYFPLNFISFLSFIVSFFLLMKFKSFAIKALNIGIVSFCILIILATYKSFIFNEIQFKFLIIWFIIFVINVFILVLINKYRIIINIKFIQTK
ncbi:hypothetical protein SAMN05421876_10727 [Kaistella jeonii]|uniref:Lipoprotein n=1 Tax=Kaistella jeonii TaxID=266749 RepID=A0A0C1F6Q6_9FLAO|nr:hypothetical protein OA86_09510 [Kaistella jeonii]SFC12669.1 hypothetical protein SAMN05421876_10727 [Kaistella jeonii]VEI94490.1 Uncharacterised protein [Kaistella jeonii]